MKKVLIVILTILFSLSAEALFEVKDASNNTVLEVSADGLRIFNEGDTLMVISSTEIKAFIDESAKDKALSRSFSVTTSAASGKGQGDVVNIAPDGLRVFSDNANLMDITTGNITAYIDTSYSFNVTSSDGGKLETDVLEVGASATKMREGDAGNQYTDFSPENIFIGLKSGINATGINNVFVGNESGITNDTGHSNVFIGPGAGYSNTSGIENVFMGFMAGVSNIDGERNVYIGNEAGLLNQSGIKNICIGDAAGKNNTASLSLFIGTNAGIGNLDGDANIFLGNESGYSNTSGEFNMYFGWLSGRTNNGNNNIFIGPWAGNGVTDGNKNVYIGQFAGNGNASGSENVFIGHNVSVTGSDKLAIDNIATSTPLIYGDFSTDALTINGTLNVTGTTYIDGSVQTESNAIVKGLLSVAGNANIYGEYLWMMQNPGTGTVPTNYVYQGGSASVDKEAAFAINDALWVTNNAFFDGALNVTGNANLNGSQTWVNHDYGASNGLFIKNKDAEFPWHFYEYSSGGLKLYYNGDLRGSWDQTTGVYTSSPGKRFKKNIEKFTNVLDKLMLLSPKRYNFISQNNSEQKYIGFIAQDVKELFPEFVQYNKEDDEYTMDYAGLSVVAIQAIKEQQKEINDLRSEIEEIKELLKK